MIENADILGVILAGGRGRRMFTGGTLGGEKGFVDLAGRPMIAHVAERFAPQVGRLIINANQEHARYAAIADAVVPDLDTGGLGPLAGLLAALTWAEAHAPSISAIASVTVDVPFLPLDLVIRLREAGGGAFAIAASDGRRHPTIGLWPAAIKDELAAALARDELGVDNFALRKSAIEVSFPFGKTVGSSVDPFFNANTPDDVDRARRLLGAE